MDWPGSTSEASSGATHSPVPHPLHTSAFFWFLPHETLFLPAGLCTCCLKYPYSNLLAGFNLNVKSSRKFPLVADLISHLVFSCKTCTFLCHNSLLFLIIQLTGRNVNSYFSHKHLNSFRCRIVSACSFLNSQCQAKLLEHKTIQ